MAEPRRFKLPSELDDIDRAERSRFGATGKVERPEYVKWRRQTLREERDDLTLRGRLLREEAESLETAAAARDMHALEALSPEDHATRFADRDAALMRGEAAPPQPVPERSQRQREEAKRLKDEAGEIEQHLAEQSTPDERT